MIDINQSLGINYGSTQPQQQQNSTPAPLPGWANPVNWWNSLVHPTPATVSTPSQPSGGYDFSNYNPVQGVKDLIANKGQMNLSSPNQPTNPVAMPYSGVGGSAADTAFSQWGDYLKASGNGAQAITTVSVPKGTPVSASIPFYKYKDSPTVYKNALYKAPTSAPAPGAPAGAPPVTSTASTGTFNPLQADNPIINPQVSGDNQVSSNILDQTPVTNNDIQSILQKNLDNQDAFIANLVSQFTDPAYAKAQMDALNSQQEVSTNDTALSGGISNIMKKPIALEFQQGQAAALTRDNAFTRSSLVNQANYYQNVLTNANTTRNQKIQAAQFMYDASRNKLSDTINLYKNTAPENIGTNYNPATGLLTATTRNPLTGKMQISVLGNIGAQKSYVTSDIKQLPDGSTAFVGVDALGNVTMKPLFDASGTPMNNGTGTSNGTPYFQGGAVNPATGQEWRTDRNNNPIAAAVTQGGSNQFTKALDSAGIKWSYGDTFGNNMSTIKIDGNGQEASRAILAGTNALQGWYASHTGASVMKQYGIKNNVDFAKASPETQNAVIAGIYKAEGGSGSLVTKPMSPGSQGQGQQQITPEYIQQVVSSLPPQLQSSVKYLPDGTPFFDGNQLVDATQEKLAQTFQGKTGIPYVNKDDAGRLQSISTTIKQLDDFSNIANSELLNAPGFLTGIGLNITQKLGGTAKTKFDSAYATALGAIESLAAGVGSGFRMTNTEVNKAIDNLPTVWDSKGQAATKIETLKNQLYAKIQQSLPGWQKPTAQGNQTTDYTALLNQLSQTALK